jgi:hypothetical protein
MKVVHIAGWGCQTVTNNIRGRDYNRLIAEQNPMLALECELQGLVNKGALGFQTRRDKLRIEAIRKQMNETSAAGR